MPPVVINSSLPGVSGDNLKLENHFLQGLNRKCPNFVLKFDLLKGFLRLREDVKANSLTPGCM